MQKKKGDQKKANKDKQQSFFSKGKKTKKKKLCKRHCSQFFIFEFLAGEWRWRRLVVFVSSFRRLFLSFELGTTPLYFQRALSRASFGFWLLPSRADFLSSFVCVIFLFFLFFIIFFYFFIFFYFLFIY